MNSLTVVSTDPNITMTTIEIAKLTNKNHFHVLRDCEKMFEQLGIIDYTKFGCTYNNEQNQTLRMYKLDRDHTLALLMVK